MKIEVEKIATLTGHKNGVYALEKSNIESTIFSAGSDGIVVSWDLENPTVGKVIATTDSSIYVLRHLSLYNHLLIGKNFEGIYRIDLDSMKEITPLKFTSSAIFDIQLVDSTLWVATGDGIVHLINYTNLEIVHQLNYSTKSARCIAVNSFLKEVAIGYSDNWIRIFDLETYELKKEWVAHTSSVFTLCYSPDHSFLLSAGRDAHLKIWDTKTYDIRQSIIAHIYAINRITYSPCGKFFLTCSMDKTIKVWDAYSFTLLKVIDRARYEGHRTSINNVYWTSYKNQIISCSDDRSICIWNLKMNEL